MEKMKTLGLIVLLSVSVTGSAVAEIRESESSYENLANRWVRERDDAILKLAQSWLRQEEANNDAHRKELLRIAMLEVRLANRDGVVLYTAALEQPIDLNDAVKQIVQAFLKDKGWNPDSAEFLRGRTFEIVDS